MKQEKVRDRFPKFQERLAKIQGDRDQTEFADFLGLSRQTVGFYLRGERIPDIQVLADIADKCNVSADYLIGLSDVETRDPTLKQICDYSGLSEKAAMRLHSLYNKEEYSVALTFVESFLHSEGIEDFELFATWSVLATIADEKMRAQNRKKAIMAEGDDEEALIAQYHKNLTESRSRESTRLWEEVSGKRPAGGSVEISSGTAAWLYQERAEDYIEDIFESALFDVQTATRDKYKK